MFHQSRLAHFKQQSVIFSLSISTISFYRYKISHLLFLNTLPDESKWQPPYLGSFLFFLAFEMF